MKELNFSTNIFFGVGALERLRQVHGKTVMIITDRFMVELGVADKVTAYLSECNVTVFDGIQPDPSMEVVAAGVQALRDCRADTIIAIGGGSAIDGAKAIRLAAKQALHTGLIDFFAIPTTSGTGSEVTDYAVITDAEKSLKYPLTSLELRPPVALLEPELTVSAPPKVTADAGMDTLTHAIEAYVSQNANDFTDALCEKAISLVFTYLPVAYKNGSNLLAYEKMQNASCMAGLAFNTAGLGVNHGMAHAVGGKFHIAHGRINAMLLPYVIAFNAGLDNKRHTEYSLAAQKYAQIAKLLGFPAANARMGVHKLIHSIEQLNRTLGIPATLKKMGIDAAEVRSARTDLISAALADMTTSTNPRPATPEQVDMILNQLLGV